MNENDGLASSPAGKNPLTCEHERFAVRATVSRLTDTDDGPVTGYMLDVRCLCSECGTPFLFKGLPVGYSPRRPMVSLSREEMRAPIEPGRKRDLSE